MRGAWEREGNLASIPHCADGRGHTDTLTHSLQTENGAASITTEEEKTTIVVVGLCVLIDRLREGFDQRLLFKLGHLSFQPYY